MQNHTAVILMAYGSPNTMSDIPDYLVNVRSGRPPTQALIDEVTARYENIGGSPLYPITQRIARKLGESIDMPVHIGMLYWHPYLEDTVKQMVAEGIHRLIAICLAPHYSEISVGRYQARLKDTLSSTSQNVELHFIEHWHDQKEYLDGLASLVQEGLRRFPSEGRDQVQIIFTAHSLPLSRLKDPSTYESQLKETVRAVANLTSLPRERWMLAYQSARNQDPSWLGPHLETLLEETSTSDKQRILVAPIGFVTNNLEILYDIDVKLQEVAQNRGIQLKRMEMLNDSLPLVAALTSLVNQTSINDQ
ncbi:MAG: ferrochelatase [Anaerolineales bacterium]|nr:ferrochelatase [Anaerolineales bacterium]MBS3753174.1 ferrochelatase [Anaerolineales bacterium]